MKIRVVPYKEARLEHFKAMREKREKTLHWWKYQKPGKQYDEQTIWEMCANLGNEISYLDDVIAMLGEAGGGIMSNKIHYQCSNCGKREQTSAWVGIPEGMFCLGYRAHGDVLYCPDCVKTWKERNGEEYDEQYKDAQHLFAAWWNRQVQMQIADKSKIKTYRNNSIGDFVEVEK